MEKLLVAILLMLVGFALGFLAINLSQQRHDRVAHGKSARTRHQQIKRRSLHGQPSSALGSPTLGFTTVTSQKSDEIARKISEASFATSETEGVQVSIGSITGFPICPYCQQTISPTDDFVICPDPKCHTKHHKTCWNSYNGCSMISCSQAPPKSL